MRGKPAGPGIYLIKAGEGKRALVQKVLKME